MRPRPLLLVLCIAVVWSAPSHGQLPTSVEEILAAVRLPVVATQARQDGITNADILTVLDAMKRARVPASEATIILDSARAARRDNGPVDNFGAFVQSQLDAGKRGQALAASIRAEHARLGRGRAGGPNRGRGGQRGATDARGRSTGTAGDAARGRSGAKTAADSAGRGGASRGRGRPPHTQS